MTREQLMQINMIIEYIAYLKRMTMPSEKMGSRASSIRLTIAKMIYELEDDLENL